jgi:hypothetical protein
MTVRRILLGWAILSAAWFGYIVWNEIADCWPVRKKYCGFDDPNPLFMTPDMAIWIFGVGFPLVALVPVLVVCGLIGLGKRYDPK